MTNAIVAAGAEDIVFSKDGRTLFVAMADGTLRTYATDTYALVQSVSIGNMLGSMSLSDDGATLLIVEQAAPAGVSRLYRVDVESGAKVAFDLPGGRFVDVQFVDSSRAIITGGQPSVQMFDAASGGFTPVPGAVVYSNSSILVKSGRYTLLAEQGISNGPLKLFDRLSGEVVASGDNYQSGASSGFNFGQEAISEHRAIVAQFSYYSSINLYDLDLKFIANVTTSGRVDGLSFDATGAFLYYHNADSGVIHKLETANWTEVGNFFVDEGSWTNYKSTGSELLIGPRDRMIALRDPQSGDVHLMTLAYTPLGVTVTGTVGNDVISANRAPAGQPKATAYDDVIYGLDGNDILDGGAGADQMHGGTGNDTFVIDDTGDQIFELAGQGTDTMKSSVVDLTLAANVEKGLVTGLLDLDIAGNELANTLAGNASANVLRGGEGKDVLNGNDGHDALFGDGGNDTLNGGNGNDSLSGGAGIDLLTGGAGSDTLTGGSEADQFKFDKFMLADGLSATDTITDFSGIGGDRDRINLSAIDANGNAGDGNQKFGFIGAAAFGGVAGQLRYEQVGGVTRVLGDTDGDGIADFQIEAVGTINFSSGDFFL